MGLQRGVVRRLSCHTPPLDPEPRHGSFLAIGLIGFDNGFVNFFKNSRACRSHVDPRVSAWKMQLHAETYLHAETVHGSTLKLSRLVSLLNEKSHAETEIGLKPHAAISLAISTPIFEYQHGADFPR